MMKQNRFICNAPGKRNIHIRQQKRFDAFRKGFICIYVYLSKSRQNSLSRRQRSRRMFSAKLDFKVTTAPSGSIVYPLFSGMFGGRSTNRRKQKRNKKSEIEHYHPVLYRKTTIRLKKNHRLPYKREEMKFCDVVITAENNIRRVLQTFEF